MAGGVIFVFAILCVLITTNAGEKLTTSPIRIQPPHITSAVTSRRMAAPASHRRRLHYAPIKATESTKPQRQPQSQVQFQTPPQAKRNPKPELQHESQSQPHLLSQPKSQPIPTPQEPLSPKAETKTESADDLPPHYRLERHLMRIYNRRLIPRRNSSRPIIVRMSIALYQIIEVNEPRQYIQLNSWIVERWEDELLYWDPEAFEGVDEIVLPYDSVWIPDTTLYNSLLMDETGNRRLRDVKLTTDREQRVARIEMLYPTLHMFSCMLDLRYFPYDVQRCAMTFGSWTHDMLEVDFAPHNRTDAGTAIGTEYCLENEGWNILSSEVKRREVKFRCCLNKYALLDFRLNIQRKPLYYLVNLIVPTSIITLIAIVGFFSSPTINNERAEKISLGITTLLSMSILIFMVSDQMPSTSSFIPLIGWFYTSMMMLISGGTLASSFVIDVQKRGFIGQRPSARAMRWARWLGRAIGVDMPLLMKQAYILKAKDKLLKQQQMLATLRLRCQQQQQAQLQRQKAAQFQHKKSRSRRPTLWNILQRANVGQRYAGTPPTSAVFQSMFALSGAPNSTGASIFTAFANAAMTGDGPPPKWSSVSLQSTPNKLPTGRFSPVDEEPPVLQSETADESADRSSGEPLIRAEEEDESVHGGEHSVGRKIGVVGFQNSINDIQTSQVTFVSQPTDENYEEDEDDPENHMSAVSREMVLSSAFATIGPIDGTSENEMTRRRRRQPPPPLGVASADDATPTIRRRPSSRRRKPTPVSPDGDFSELNGKDSVAATPTASEAGQLPAVGNPEAAGLPKESTARETGGGTATGLSASQRRNLAQLEYDWLAAVIERIFFIIFCILFFFMSFGINLLGIYKWYFWAFEDTVELR